MMTGLRRERLERRGESKDRGNVDFAKNENQNYEDVGGVRFCAEFSMVWYCIVHYRGVLRCVRQIYGAEVFSREVGFPIA